MGKTLKDWIGPEKGTYVCNWECTGTASCGLCKDGTNRSNCLPTPYVHKWSTVRLADGNQRHTFTATRCPPFTPPQEFPQPPQCPALPGPPTDAFLKVYLREDDEWARWENREASRQKAAFEAIAAEKALKRVEKKKATEQAVRRAISALDCPAKRGFFTKIDEGNSIIARCGGGSHTLELQALVSTVARQGFSAQEFTQFVYREKHKLVGRDVNDIVAGYIEVTPLPDAEQLEAELESFQTEATKKAEQDHEQRVRAKKDEMKTKRKQARNNHDVKESWAASFVDSADWQSFLSQAERWIAKCEALIDDWDEYDHARNLVQAELGDIRGFVDRSKLPSTEPADWACHPVLKHAQAVAYLALAQRWLNLGMQRL